MSIRPHEVSELSDAKFRRLTQTPASSTGYVFKGDRDYRFSGGLRAKEVLQSVVRKKCCSIFRKFAVLDIGTGGGQFLLDMPRGVKAYGITATNMRPIPPDNTYRICNAENLLEQFSPNSFDLIVSHLAFIHMVDPHQALKGAYTALKPGGFLLLDRFQLKGVDTQEWIDRMQQSGHEIASVPTFGSDGEKSGVEFMMIRKTKAAFESLIRYDRIEKEKCRYALIDSKGPLSYKHSHALGYLTRSSIDRIQAYERDQDEHCPPLPEEDVALLRVADGESAKSLRRAHDQLDEWDIPYTS